MSDWVTKPLGELITLQRGHDLPSQDRKEGTVPIMGSSGITGYHDEVKTTGPGVVIGRSGNSMGEVSFSPIDFWPLNTCLYVTDFKGNDERYIYYLLQTINFDQFNSGSAQKSLNRNAVYPYEVKTTECKEEQVRIARNLADLEDKIELNRQTNQTLEHMAQAIFKSWFVDFEPTRAKAHARAHIAKGIMPSDNVFVSTFNLGEDAQAAKAQQTLPKNFSQADADQLVERAAMAAISGKPLSELDNLPAEILEQLKTTAALFPETLVDSELGVIPEGWEVASVDDICDFQNGYAFKSKEMSKSPIDTYKVFKMGHIKKGGGLNQDGTKDYYDKNKCKKLERYLIKKGDLLMCMTDMKNNVALLGHTALMDVDNEYILNQRVGLLRTKNIKKANYPFLYILTNSEAFLDDLRSRANSGVQVNLSTKGIKETKLILPSEPVHIAFDKVLERSQEVRFSLEGEQEYLAEIRDALLPKLLSGELSTVESGSK